MQHIENMLHHALRWAGALQRGELWRSGGARVWSGGLGQKSGLLEAPAEIGRRGEPPRLHAQPACRLDVSLRVVDEERLGRPEVEAVQQAAEDLRVGLGNAFGGGDDRALEPPQELV